MEEKKIPRHIGIIMDGNGRWAQQKGKKRSYGHKAGSENVQKVAEHAFRRGVEIISLYAFSSENWARPREEVDELMRLLGEHLKKLASKAVKNGIRIDVLGNKERLSPKLNKIIAEQTAKTAGGKKILNILIDYGGRGEIVHALKALKASGAEITEESVSRFLYTAGLPDPDLIVRTGGELRLSNFLLYQSAYAELYFTDVLWPDFGAEELDKALESYASRKRRYGKIEC
ncbi:MAG: polyprenyl diphosphate synthase [Eubacteriales bacterium]